MAIANLERIAQRGGFGVEEMVRLLIQRINRLKERYHINEEA